MLRARATLTDLTTLLGPHAPFPPGRFSKFVTRDPFPPGPFHESVSSSCFPAARLKTRYRFELFLTLPAAWAENPAGATVFAASFCGAGRVSSKALRWRRLFGRDGRLLLVAMDHAGFMGP